MNKMALAKLVSLSSRDTHTQVGCIFSKGNKILSCGYNKPVDNMEITMNREGNWLDTKYPYMVHAEVNAICDYDGKIKDFKDSELYVTLFPCNECAKLISTLGIKKVYFITDRTEDIYIASKKILESSGIEYEQLI